MASNTSMPKTEVIKSFKMFMKITKKTNYPHRIFIPQREVMSTSSGRTIYIYSGTRLFNFDTYHMKLLDKHYVQATSIEEMEFISGEVDG